MSSEDDGGLAGRVPVVMMVLAVVQGSRVSVPAVGRRWVERIFGQQLVVQVQICTVSVD